MSYCRAGFRDEASTQRMRAIRLTRAVKDLFDGRLDDRRNSVRAQPAVNVAVAVERLSSARHRGRRTLEYRLN